MTTADSLIIVSPRLTRALRAIVTCFVTAPMAVVRVLGRTTGLLVAALLAVADATLVRLVTEPNASRFAHARAAWLHRWSRLIRRILGLRVERRGYAPVSGMVVANYTGLVDTILLAAIRPCVFVAGNEVRHWPVVGFFARMGGTIFLDPSRQNDISRINFLIQRAIDRRLLVVIFPECGNASGSQPRTFSSALFQPVAELGCTLTAAGICYHTPDGGNAATFARMKKAWEQIIHFLSAQRAGATVNFGTPVHRLGDRKELARQLRGEVLDLNRRAEHAG